ncbi:MAG: GNAT family N-acetyltransferase [Clostridia bacterium]|nr:GNAT family N-acetyltransferase [Clostridia bacterium]
MIIKKMKAPLTQKEIKPFYDIWNRVFGIDEAESASKKLTGYESEYNDMYIYSCWDGNVLLGTTHITMSKLCPSVCGIGCVCSSEEARGRGIGKIIFSAVLEDFDSAGGQAAFLATGNPVAANLYQSFGFQYLPGTKAMCRFTNTNRVRFEKEFYEKSELTVLKNSPYLRTLMLPLALTTGTAFSLDSNIQLFSSKAITQIYCESLYPKYEKLWEDGGITFSLHNKNGAVCAVASIADYRIDVFYHQDYAEESKKLIEACQVYTQKPYVLIAKNDCDKEKLFTEMGYRPCGEEVVMEFNGYNVPFARFEKNV